MRRIFDERILPAVFCSIAAFVSTGSAETLFQSKRLTPKDCKFARHIEGPSVDASGSLYVMNLGVDGKIGKINPSSGACEIFAALPQGSIGNGSRFDRNGRMYVADFSGHQVLVFEPGRTIASPYCQAAFHQPNDLAIAADGTLFASDPVLKPAGSGRIWRITRGADGAGHGEILNSDRPMGPTNGIDLSPDGKTLYVGVSFANVIRAYRIQGSKLVPTGAAAALGVAAPDGLRTDVDGRIYVTEALPAGGRVEIFTPDLKPALAPVVLVGKNPTNLTFGGPDGRTVFVTIGGIKEADRFVESFRVDRPGREPCMQGFITGCPQ